MSEDKLDLDDAISIAWVNAPDAMQVIIDEMIAVRELKFNAVREAKQKGIGSDWVLGEMLAYQEMVDNLSKPNQLTVKPL